MAISSASGGVRISNVDNIVVKTASGSVGLGTVTSAASVKSASGEFENRIEPSGVEPVGGARLSIKSFSGDVALRSSW